jgi:hypothetical protein
VIWVLDIRRHHGSRWPHNAAAEYHSGFGRS